MLSITLAGQGFALPETWPEVPRKLLPRLLELLYAAPESGQTHHELLRLTLGLTAKDWKRLNAHYFAERLPEDVRQANARVLHDLLTAIGWMWQTDLTVKPLDALKVDGVRYLLPDEAFRTMTFGELTDAYIHAQAFIKQLVPGEERLNLLLATVCRPAAGGSGTDDDASGDPREPYNAARSQQRAAAMAQVPAHDRVAVLMYFLGTLKDFLSHYELWETDTIEATVSEEEYPGQGLIKNQHLLAEKGVFGTMREVKATNVHDVFLYLEEHRKDEIAQLEAEKAASKS